MDDKTAERLAQTIASVFTTPDRVDSNMENANVVDGLYAIADSIRRLAEAIEYRNDDPDKFNTRDVTVSESRP